MQKTLFLLIIFCFSACSNDTKNEDKDRIDATEVTDSEVNTNEVSIDTLETESVNSVNNNEKESSKELLVEDTKTDVIPTPKPTPKPKKLSKIHVTEPNHEFGRKTEGDMVEHTFEFINTGEADLVIKDVLVDCGCTVPDFPKEAILPGNAGSIAVKFDTKGKIGMQERIITILTNGDPVSKIVRLKGIVDTE